jgi:hypothetical protein
MVPPQKRRGGRAQQRGAHPVKQSLGARVQPVCHALLCPSGKCVELRAAAPAPAATAVRTRGRPAAVAAVAVAPLGDRPTSARQGPLLARLRVQALPARAPALRRVGRGARARRLGLRVQRGRGGECPGGGTRRPARGPPVDRRPGGRGRMLPCVACAAPREGREAAGGAGHRGGTGRGAGRRRAGDAGHGHRIFLVRPCGANSSSLLSSRAAPPSAGTWLPGAAGSP